MGLEMLHDQVSQAPVDANSEGPRNPRQDQQAVLNAFAASRHLHPKQLELLRYLNQRRDPRNSTQTVPLSYTHLHHATGITIEHIRRNGLHRLFACGLVSVVYQGLGGTIYRLHYDNPTLQQIFERVGPAPSEPMGTGPDLGPHESELASLERRLAVLTQLEDRRREVQQAEFLNALSVDQRAWLVDTAKTAVDHQEGIRFVRDRFPHYEAQRLRLIEEWVARASYGETVPSRRSTHPTESV